MPDWALDALGIVLLINAAWLLFMGGYTDRLKGGATHTYEFARAPFRYSATVGIVLSLALFCLYHSHPEYLPKIISKVPQLKFVVDMLRQKNGAYQVFGGLALAMTVVAFLFRHFLLSVSTFTKGDELDLSTKEKRAWQARETQEKLDFERKHGKLRDRFEGDDEEVL